MMLFFGDEWSSKYIFRRYKLFDKYVIKMTLDKLHDMIAQLLKNLSLIISFDHAQNISGSGTMVPSHRLIRVRVTRHYCHRAMMASYSGFTLR